ncbi:MAG: prohibitin family protein [Thermoanaerobaculum sp.]|nr:prohibitin family protein [Thermoanaerobaculum sp.]MDW7967860.1 prohibitin family protein [Thermoanaerobaculum sp.]
MEFEVRRLRALPGSGDRRWVRLVLVGIILVVLLLFGNPIAVVPAGHVGVKDFFGIVSPSVLQPGVRLVLPFTRVVKMSVRTQEMKEVAEVPSKEGLIMNLEASLLFRLDAARAPEVYKTIGPNYPEVVVEPQFRSAIREITASYEAKALYSAERERIAQEVLQLFRKLTADRGVVTEQVLLRKIGLPPVVANAIQEKLRREQEAEQMKFILLKEQQEAERKRIEAQGIADFQRIVSQGISQQLLEWKGIEATEKLAASQNAKVVIIGNPKTGLPVILSAER